MSKGVPVSVKVKYNKHETLSAYLLLSPVMVGFLVFGLLPIIASLLLSFTKWDLFSAPQWIGITNFVESFVISWFGYLFGILSFLFCLMCHWEGSLFR